MRFFTPRSIFELSLQSIFSDPSFVTDEMVDRYRQLQLRKGSRAATLARFQVPRDYEAIEGISRIRSPTLILWGDEDNLTPVGDAQKFAAAIPNSRVRIYRGVGHVPMEEVAAQSAADVREFLRAASRD